MRDVDGCAHVRGVSAHDIEEGEQMSENFDYGTEAWSSVPWRETAVL